MKCTYNDGMTATYSGPFQVLKGKDINVFVSESRLPDDIRADLEKALYKNSCSLMRGVADSVTKTYGSKACVH